MFDVCVNACKSKSGLVNLGQDELVHFKIINKFSFGTNLKKKLSV